MQSFLSLLAIAVSSMARIGSGNDSAAAGQAQISIRAQTVRFKNSTQDSAPP